MNLCTIAFHGMMEKRFTFPSDMLPNDFDTLGLRGVQIYSSCGTTVTYNFIHLAIQELLAAYYIHTTLPESELILTITKLFNERRYIPVLQFYTAMSKLEKPAVVDVVRDFVARNSSYASKDNDKHCSYFCTVFMKYQNQICLNP